MMQENNIHMIKIETYILDKLKFVVEPIKFVWNEL